MKLRMEDKVGVRILHIEGAVDAHQFSVIRAGMVKILKNGKNKILVNFESSANVDQDAIRQVSELNAAARELSGEIVLVMSDPKMRGLVENFSKPPLVMCFSAVQEGLDHFNKSKAKAAPEPEDAATKNDEELLKQNQTLKSEVEQLRKQLTETSKGEAKNAKDESTRSKGLLEKLEIDIEKLQSGRRVAPDAETYEAKIGQLEGRIHQLVEELKTHQNDKPKSP